MRENAKQEMPVEDQFYDYPDRPVPADKRRTQLNIAVVTTGMARSEEHTSELQSH